MTTYRIRAREDFETEDPSEDPYRETVEIYLENEKDYSQEEFKYHIDIASHLTRYNFYQMVDFLIKKFGYRKMISDVDVFLETNWNYGSKKEITVSSINDRVPSFLLSDEVFEHVYPNAELYEQDLQLNQPLALAFQKKGYIVEKVVTKVIKKSSTNEDEDPLEQMEEMPLVDFFKSFIDN